MNTEPGTEQARAGTAEWAIVAVWLLCMLGMHLALTLTGFPVVRDQHLGAALNYARNGIDLLNPVIVGFNANGVPTPQEFPVWQALTALLMRWTTTWWGWGNVVSWLAVSTSVWAFHRLAGEVLASRAAWWSVLALLAQPLIFWQAGQAGTDGTALAVSIWFLFAAAKFVREGSWRWWTAAALLGILSATLKLPFFGAAGIAAVGLIVHRVQAGWRRWCGLSLVGTVALVGFACWTAHCESQFARAEFPFVDLRIGDNPAMQAWYFGSLGFRTDASNWLRGAYRAAVGLCGSMALVVIPATALLDKSLRLPRWWLAGGAIMTAVFTGIVLQHWHYFLMFSPAVALLCGAMLGRLEEVVRRNGTVPRIGWLLLCTAMLAIACVQGLHSGRFLHRDPYPARMAALIREHTGSGDRLLIAGGGWGGLELMSAEREGLTIADTRLLETPAHLHRLEELGFTKLVLLSQSPLRASIAVAGGSQPARVVWQSLATPIVDRFKPVWQSEDIAVFSLPLHPEPPVKSILP